MSLGSRSSSGLHSIAIGVMIYGLVGCGGGSSEEAELLEAATSLRAFIDATAAEALPGDETSQGDAGGRQLCSSTDDEVREDYWLYVQVPSEEVRAAVEAVRAAWEEQSLEVGGGDGETAPHEVTVQFDGYGVRAAAAPDGGVVIVGSTRCFAADAP